MRIIIDTSSLLALVRYYRPFDKDNSLKYFFKDRIDSGDILILDKVAEESKYISKGLIIKDLDFLQDKKRYFKTDELLPTKKFFNILDNQLCQTPMKNRLSQTEYEQQRNEYLDSADAKLILFCYNESNPLGIDNPLIVTEETGAENDNKIFKKLPTICSILNIEQCSLPTLIKDHFKIKLSQYLE
ncbi:MAG TPA: DUF4411 family protein [Candidatus Nanoarchaeia archaeon]|nr:DUF4411 family protein [Candidatus Nanoarchaeia archaeon]